MVFRHGGNLGVVVVGIAVADTVVVRVSWKAVRLGGNIGVVVIGIAVVSMVVTGIVCGRQYSRILASRSL